VVPNPHKEETQSEMIQKILHDFDSNNSAIDETDISVVHSSLDVLKQCKSFLEEDP
jgi:prephenate dehydratase